MVRKFVPHYLLAFLIAGLSFIWGTTTQAQESSPSAFTVLAVLQHRQALSQPHDIEVQGPLAFVAGKGGSVAVVDVRRLQAPRLVWWQHDPQRLADAQTVLPHQDHLYLGARSFFSIDIRPAIKSTAEPFADSQPMQSAQVELPLSNPVRHASVDRINGMVRIGSTLFSANKTGWITAFDVAEPSQPKLAGSLNTREHANQRSPHDIAHYQEYVVVVDQADQAPLKLRLYRVLDSPSGKVLSADRWQPAGSVARDDWNGANRVVVSGDYAFVACSKSSAEVATSTLGAAKLTDPARPQHVWTLPFAGIHPTGLTVAGKVLFAAGGQIIQALDISNPDQPRTLAVLQSEKLFPTGRDNAHDLVYHAGHLYVTAQNDDQIGIVRIDDLKIRRLADFETIE